MGSLLSQLIPTAVAGAIAPAVIVIVITLLMSKGGLAKATSFAIALIGTFAVVGVVVLVTSGAKSGSTTGGSAVTGTIVAVLGAVLVLMALKQILHAPDPDAAPPKFMTKLDTMSVGGAFVFGVVMAFLNFKQMSIYIAGISQIVAADVSTAQAWVALVILLLLIQSGVIVVILAYVFARAWAKKALGASRGWLVAHNRVISIALGLVVGVWFLVKGITQIVG